MNKIKPKIIKGEEKNIFIKSFGEVDMSRMRLPAIALYKHPDDMPDVYVARVFDIDKPTNVVCCKAEEKQLHADIKENTGMIFIKRGEGDVKSLIGLYI